MGVLNQVVSKEKQVHVFRDSSHCLDLVCPFNFFFFFFFFFFNFARFRSVVVGAMISYGDLFFKVK